MEAEKREVDVLHDEFRWILKEEVDQVLADVYATLVDCGRRLPLKMSLGDSSLVRPQRILLTSANGAGNVKCVVTLLGDSICEADINFKHKLGNQQLPFHTAIQADLQWKLQQVQDASNHLANALTYIINKEKSPAFTSAKQVHMLLDKIMESLSRGRSSLVLPRRKSLDELLSNRNMQSFHPALPSDVAMSFYIHSHKLILALYYLQQNQQQKMEITARYQVESTVQWLNEILILFTIALQQCQQLKDKLLTLQQFDEISKSVAVP